MAELTPRIIKRFNEVQADLKKATEIVAEGGTTILCSLLSAAVIGSPEQAALLVAPGAVNIAMNYLRMRRENNIIYVFDVVQEKRIVLADALQKIPREAVREYRDRIFPLVFEYAEDELEQEKIKLFVNGFESAVEQQVTEMALILKYNDTLRSLREIDIAFLINIPLHTYDEENALKLPLDKNYFDLFSPDSLTPGLQRTIVLDLESKGLIMSDPMWKADGPFIRDQLKVTQFGQSFIDYFKLKAASV